MKRSKFLFTVVGNYTVETGNLIKGPLIRLLMDIKGRTLGYDLVMVLSKEPSGLGALLIGCAKSNRIPVEFLEISEALVSEVGLVVKLKLIPANSLPDVFKDELSDAFDKAIDPWSDNSKTFELKIPVAKFVPRVKFDLSTEVVPTTITSPSSPSYEAFSEVREFLQKVTTEVPNVVSRDNIPAHGVDVPSDVSLSGGMQFQS